MPRWVLQADHAAHDPPTGRTPMYIGLGTLVILIILAIIIF
jgi:hypothetical protein